jgi:hypothetical protein
MAAQQAALSPPGRLPARVGAPVQDHRGALGGVAELVGVGRHRGHPGDREVEGGHVEAEPPRPRQDEAAQAGVGVEADPALGGDGGQLPDGVDDPVREAGGRADQGHRPAGHGPRHGPDVGPEVRPHRHPHELDPEVLGRLVEGDVGAGRGDHLGAGGPPPGPAPGPVPVGLHGQQDALGPARGDRPHHLAGRVAAGVAAAEEGGGHGHDLGLELGPARPQVGVQRVDLGGGRVHPVQEGHVVVAAVVHRPRSLPVAPAGPLPARQVLDRGQDLAGAKAALGQPGEAGHLPPVGLERPLDPGQEPLVLPVQAGPDGRDGQGEALGRGRDPGVEAFQPGGDGGDVHELLPGYRRPFSRA